MGFASESGRALLPERLSVLGAGFALSADELVFLSASLDCVEEFAVLDDEVRSDLSLAGAAVGEAASSVLLLVAVVLAGVTSWPELPAGVTLLARSLSADD